MMGEEAGEDEGTGVPGLRNWGAVYGVVVGVFVIYVVVLAGLARAFR